MMNMRRARYSTRKLALALLLSAALVLTMTPVGAVVAYAANDGDTIDLEETLASTSNITQTNWSYTSESKTITVTNDVEIIGTATTTSKVTLNIAPSKTATWKAGLTNTALNTTALELASAGAFIVGEGYVRNSGDGAGISVLGGTVSVNGGSVECLGSGNAISAIMQLSKSSVVININSGQVSSEGSSAISMTSYYSSPNNVTLNISGGTVSSNSASNATIMQTDMSKLSNNITISGGVILSSNAQAISVTSTNNLMTGANQQKSISISGGVIRSTGDGASAIKIQAIKLGSYTCAITVAVTGGIIESEGDAFTLSAGNGTSADCTVNGDAVIKGYRLAGQGTLTNDITKGIVFTDGVGAVYGEVTLPGDLTVADGETLEISPGGLTVPSGATLTIASGGAVDVVFDGNPFDDIHVNAGGEFVIEEGGTLVNSDVIVNEGAFDNNGTIYNLGLIENDGVFENSGTINNNANIYNIGDMENSGEFDNNGGTFENDNGGMVENSGAITNTGTVINDFGGTVENSGTIVNEGTYTNDGTYNGTGGTVTGSGIFDGYDPIGDQPEPPGPAKTTPAALAAPTLVSRTQTSVTLTATAGAEFSRDGSTWQASASFAGLTADTAYTFYQRLKETATTYASPASPGLVVRTLPETQTQTPPDDRKPVSLAGAQIKVAAQAAWTGKAITPAVTVTLGGKTLKNGVDYRVGYSANTAIGKATVTVRAKSADYTGSKSATFNIVPKKVTAKKATAGKRSVKVTWTRAKAAQKITKYIVKYRVKGTSKWKSKSVAASKSSLTIKKLKKGKAYQVQVYAVKTIKSGASKGTYLSPSSKTLTSKKVK